MLLSIWGWFLTDSNSINDSGSCLTNNTLNVLLTAWLCFWIDLRATAERVVGNLQNWYVDILKVVNNTYEKGHWQMHIKKYYLILLKIENGIKLVT